MADRPEMRQGGWWVAILVIVMALLLTGAAYWLHTETWCPPSDMRCAAEAPVYGAPEH